MITTATAPSIQHSSFALRRLDVIAVVVFLIRVYRAVVFLLGSKYRAEAEEWLRSTTWRRGDNEGAPQCNLENSSAIIFCDSGDDSKMVQCSGRGLLRIRAIIGCRWRQGSPLVTAKETFNDAGEQGPDSGAKICSFECSFESFFEYCSKRFG